MTTNFIDYHLSDFEFTKTPEDGFHYNGEGYGCISQSPSLPVIKFQNLTFKSPMDYINTAYHPPYTCKWKIENDNLFLTEFIGSIELDSQKLDNTDNSNFKEIYLTDLFPDQKEVFAEWYSGRISLVSGFYEIIKYHKDGKRIFPKIIHLTFENGVLVNREVELTRIPFKDKFYQFLIIMLTCLLLLLIPFYIIIEWTASKVRSLFR